MNVLTRYDFKWAEVFENFRDIADWHRVDGTVALNIFVNPNLIMNISSIIKSTALVAATMLLGSIQATLPANVRDLLPQSSLSDITKLLTGPDAANFHTALGQRSVTKEIRKDPSVKASVLTNTHADGAVENAFRRGTPNFAMIDRLMMGPNVQSKKGIYRAMQLAAANGKIDAIDKWIARNRCSIADALVGAGAAKNSKYFLALLAKYRVNFGPEASITGEMLERSARFGAPEVSKWLLREANINSPSRANINRMIGAAAESGNLSVVKAILDGQFGVRTVQFDRHVAFSNAAEHNHIAIMKLVANGLIREGEYGRPFNFIDAANMAAVFGHIAVIKYVLSLPGAEQFQDSLGKFYEFAAKNNRVDILRYFSSKPFFTLRKRVARNALRAAAKEGGLDAIKELMMQRKFKAHLSLEMLNDALADALGEHHEKLAPARSLLGCQ
jgi:hypothetical protein